MRRELAERLLTNLMEWSDAEKANERAILDAFANYKYDEYQQYAPGRRFLESLALWLEQFETVDQRRAAYGFLRNRLVFISDAEMTHLVELSFPSFVRPHLMRKTAAVTGLETYRVKEIVQTLEYKLLLRQTLILGLSDGARTDRFRRANPQEISNEQIWHAYDISDDKADDMLEELVEDLTLLLGRAPSTDEARFKTVVLLDDFTASGTSYLREDDSKPGEWKGKIAKIIKKLDAGDGIGGVIAKSDVKIIVVIYVASTQAVDHIEKRLSHLPYSKGDIEFQVVHKLDASIQLDEIEDQSIFELLENDDYFDETANDKHGAVGGASVKYGYANCRLPIILSHNTPNNSIFLLWAEDSQSVQGLFPRVSRHRKFE